MPWQHRSINAYGSIRGRSSRAMSLCGSIATKIVPGRSPSTWLMQGPRPRTQFGTTGSSSRVKTRLIPRTMRRVAHPHVRRTYAGRCSSISCATSPSPCQWTVGPRATALRIWHCNHASLADLRPVRRFADPRRGYLSDIELGRSVKIQGCFEALFDEAHSGGAEGASTFDDFGLVHVLDVVAHDAC